MSTRTRSGASLGLFENGSVMVDRQSYEDGRSTAAPRGNDYHNNREKERSREGLRLHAFGDLLGR